MQVSDSLKKQLKVELIHFLIDTPPHGTSRWQQSHDLVTQTISAKWVYSPTVYTHNPLYHMVHCSRSMVRYLKTTGSTIHTQNMNVV